MKTAFGDHVRVAAAGHVAVVTIDRPPHNHVSVDFMHDLADAFDAIDAEVELRCSVLQAEGKNFCAGADLVRSESAGGLGSVNPLYDEAVRLFSVQKPIVAAVQGAAVGAGLGLAVVADFRIASPDAALKRLRDNSSPTVPNACSAARNNSRSASQRVPGCGICPKFLCAIEIDLLTRLPHSLASSKLVRRTNSSQVKSASWFSGPAAAMK